MDSNLFSLYSQSIMKDLLYSLPFDVLQRFSDSVVQEVPADERQIRKIVHILSERYQLIDLFHEDRFDDEDIFKFLWTCGLSLNADVPIRTIFRKYNSYITKCIADIAYLDDLGQEAKDEFFKLEEVKSFSTALVRKFVEGVNSNTLSAVLSEDVILTYEWTDDLRRYYVGIDVVVEQFQTFWASGMRLYLLASSAVEDETIVCVSAEGQVRMGQASGKFNLLLTAKAVNMESFAKVRKIFFRVEVTPINIYIPGKKRKVGDEISDSKHDDSCE